MPTGAESAEDKEMNVAVELARDLSDENVCIVSCVDGSIVASNNINEELCNRDVWKEGHRLRICDRIELPIYVNVPQVLSLQAPIAAISGIPILPVISNSDFVRFQAHHEQVHPNLAGMMEALHIGKESVPQSTANSLVAESEVEWEWALSDSDGEAASAIVSNERVYTPTHNDTGKLLSVTCQPRLRDENKETSTDNVGPRSLLQQIVAANASESKERILSTISRHAVCRTLGAANFVVGVVEEAPVRQYMHRRMKEFENGSTDGNSLNDTFRVVTYNILAAAYEHTWDKLYPYLNVKYARAEYRQQLVLQVCLWQYLECRQHSLSSGYHVHFHAFYIAYERLLVVGVV